MNAKSLLEWANNHNAKNETIQSFWECFNKWRKEDRKDYLDTFDGKLYNEFITVEESEMYLKLRFGMEEAFIFYSINIYYLHEHIGTYDLEFFLNGEIADNYLDFDNSKSKILKIKQSIRLARNAIKEGIELKAISNITGINEGALQILKEKYC
ncbi:hypothetical protein ACFSO7_08590 [Bacillus sp. CGMCC 1.16607]|uniref:hypothetical protein n=1 Tax=Bacillus sp. CGMCC 1.16607 TaxID=3351842 RepID=UPI00362D3B66